MSVFVILITIYIIVFIIEKENYYIINKYDIRADVWSLGITLCEIAYGHIPYKEVPDLSLEDLGQVQRLINTTNGKSLIDQSLETIKYSLLSNQSEQEIEKQKQSVKEFVGICLQTFENRPTNYGSLINTSFYQHFSVYIRPESVAKWINELNIFNDDNRNESKY